MERVDYVNTFIAVAPDSSAVEAVAPPARATPSVAERTWRLIAEHPYEFTSGDVIFTVHADRAGIPESERPRAREEFYAVSRACLRSSDLGKRYGWGLHADENARLALVGVETAEYQQFVSGDATSESGEPIVVTRAMRSARR